MTAIASPSFSQQNGVSKFSDSGDQVNDDTMMSEESKIVDSSTTSGDSSLKKNGSSPVKTAMMSSDDEEDNVPWAKRLQQQAASGDTKKEPSTPSTSKRKKAAAAFDDSDWDEDLPKKKKKSSAPAKKESAKKVKREPSYSSDEDAKPAKKKKSAPTSTTTKKIVEVTKTVKKEEIIESGSSPEKKPRKKKIVEEEEVWKWWEEEKKEDGIKWNSLEHKGPLFAPDYEILPKSVKFFYDGKEMRLSAPAEEVATFYAKMLDHEYTSRSIFNQNFFKDWRKVGELLVWISALWDKTSTVTMMTSAERETITELAKCDFKPMAAYFLTETEKRRAMTKEEKQKIKVEKEAEAKEYGFAIIDGHKQKIGNFRIEPPGLFRGRGDHPKMGRLKKRVQPEDVVINCGKTSKIPSAPAGHKWKEVRHDNTVSWLCGWTENVLGNNKYIMLNPSSKIKGEKDWEKFETARKLKSLIGDIRQQYTIDFKSREMRVRQRAVALYFIDKLALRAGNEKDTEEAADTVGCCSLRCEHVKLFDELDDQKYVVEFDFLGKDSIRYVNKVPVDKTVFKNVKLFMENKEPGDDLFDRLDTSSLNAHLRTLMPGLSAKVFRTYNASITLQEQLEKLTKENDNIHNKMLSYNRANRLVAILCNHQRAVPKTHEKSMENLENKISEKKKEVKQLKSDLEKTKSKVEKEKLQKRLDQKKDQLKKLKIQRTDKDENKQIALGTSKLNYLDPRISVAWCKKFDVPVEKIFNKTQREKFRWAIDMATEDYEF